MLKKTVLYLFGGIILFPVQLFAQDLATLSFTVNNLWILIAATLVFLMHLGFASLEAGLTRSKNTVNILFKNLSIISMGLLTFSYFGFNLMYPGDAFSGGLFGFSGFGLGTDAAGITPAYNPGYTYWTDFIFQAMFAATAATIVSGAVAERIKLGSFLIFSTLLVGVCYPVLGFWTWGGGFLSKMATPFYDFAGSTIVHSVGGWSALIAVIILGPRIGKYVNGKSQIIKPHNFSLLTIGVFLLWLGWFGFNGGSVLSADPGAVSLVFVTTALSGAAGVISAMLVSWYIRKKPDLAMSLNGALAGLVGITAGANLMSPNEAVLIGLVAGVLVVNAVRFFDRLQIDDPVGAISVHLVCGVWGTLAVGLFGRLASGAQLVAQLKGVICYGIGAVVFSTVSILLIQQVHGWRVSKEEEIQGLDSTEHGDASYSYCEDDANKNESSKSRENEKKVETVHV